MNNRFLTGVTAMLMFGGLLAASQACAQPHREVTIEDVIVPTPPQDVWLRRLVGNYKLDGAFGTTGIKGKMNCIAVGDGPGVQCIVNALWTLYVGFPPIDLSSFLDPAMILFGLDPGRSEINLMLVNDRGLPSGGFGTVKGHLGAFRTICAGANEDGCSVGIRIEAKPEANINYMWIGEGLVISMRRVPAEDARASQGRDSARLNANSRFPGTPIKP